MWSWLALLPPSPHASQEGTLETGKIPPQKKGGRVAGRGDRPLPHSFRPTRDRRQPHDPHGTRLGATGQERFERSFPARTPPPDPHGGHLSLNFPRCTGRGAIDCRGIAVQGACSLRVPSWTPETVRRRISPRPGPGCERQTPTDPIQADRPAILATWAMPRPVFAIVIAGAHTVHRLSPPLVEPHRGVTPRVPPPTTSPCNSRHREHKHASERRVKPQSRLRGCLALLPPSRPPIPPVTNTRSGSRLAHPRPTCSVPSRPLDAAGLLPAPPPINVGTP